MAQQQTNALKSFRVPLVGAFQNRNGVADKDQRFINCFPESRKNDITETKKIYLYQRPGLNPINTVASGQEGRGIHHWNGYTYSVFGNKIYKGTTAIKTIGSSTGMCSIEVGTTPSEDVLVVADGTLVYVIEANDTVTEVPLNPAAWTSGATIAEGAWRVPTTGNGFYYEALNAGTTGGTEPTWPVFLGETVTDNGITWIAQGYTNTAGAWQSSHAYTVGQQIKVTVAGTDYMFGVYASGTSGGSAPTWSVTTSALTTDGTVTWICLGPFLDNAPPKYHKPSLAYLDGYMFLVLKRNDGSDSADVYNCDLDNPYSWNPTNYIVANQFPDKMQALARQNNMLVAFGTSSVEFFYDAGNSTGTPLAVNQSYTLQVGIAAPHAIYQNERFCIFTAQSQSGGRAVWLLDGFSPKKISDEYIERILDVEGTAIADATGFGLRTNGHLFYVLNLTDRSVVYDLEEKMWHEWTGTNVVAMTDDSSGKAILQDGSNGKTYYMDPTIGTDNGVAINMEVYTTKYDFETMNLKSMQSFNYVSDLQQGKTIQVRWSDDDYNTWSDWRTISLYPRAYFTTLGSFRRRAFNIKYTGGIPFRSEAIEFDVRQWKA